MLALIRDARPKEAERLARFSADCFRDTFGHLYTARNLADFLAEKHSADYYASRLSDPACKTLIAENAAGALRGYVHCGPVSVPVDPGPQPAAEMHRLYVATSAQGMGLGQRLFDASFGWEGFSTARAIYISVFSENEGAQRFYRRNGFDKVGEYAFVVGTQRDREFIFARLAQ